MKRNILLLASLFVGGTVQMAAQGVDGTAVQGLRLERNGEYMVVDMTMMMRRLAVESNRAVLFTPRLVNGADSLDLPGVGVYGRRRYYYYMRNGANMLTGADGQNFKAARKPDSLAYHTVVPYAEWMNGAALVLQRDDYGCCNTLLDEQRAWLGQYAEAVDYKPELVYVYPTAHGEKTDSLCGSAYIEFVVNRFEIKPDYRRNREELDKIKASILSIQNDKDVTITSVGLKGYASPESPYAHNSYLAENRTAALKDYVNNLFHFADGVIQTAYEPEDWDGLRRFVEASNLEHRTEILALIDSSLDPDTKEDRIRARYPREYRFLKEECYPALRHTDYRIAYVIRQFTDVEEIKRLMKTQPNKLSLNEFYLVAQTYELGSDAFNEVFETAVRMFPDDAVANLNAANTAMQRGNLAVAERYLGKAGHSPQAEYARAALAVLKEDYDQALDHVVEARKGGVTQADKLLEYVTKMRSK